MKKTISAFRFSGSHWCVCVCVCVRAYDQEIICLYRYPENVGVCKLLIQLSVVIDFNVHTYSGNY